MSQVAADLKMLIETANAPIFGIDAAGLVNEWNRKSTHRHARHISSPTQAEALTACVPFPLSVQAMDGRVPEGGGRGPGWCRYRSACRRHRPFHCSTPSSLTTPSASIALHSPHPFTHHSRSSTHYSFCPAPLFQDFITAEFQDSVNEVLQNALVGKETDNFEFPLYTKDGTRVYVLLNASSRRDNSVKHCRRRRRRPGHYGAEGSGR